MAIGNHTGNRRGIKHTPTTKEKMRVAALGRVISTDQRKRISMALKGRKPWNYQNGRGGFNRTSIHEQFVERGHSRNWKGGYKLYKKRERAKRRAYGFDQLNETFVGCERHHIDKNHVVFIPKELHRSVWHSLNRPETMEQINTKVICWLLGVDCDVK